jgi:hypothetical protein
MDTMEPALDWFSSSLYRIILGLLENKSGQF